MSQGKSSIFVILLLLVVVGVGGYFLMQSQQDVPPPPQEEQEVLQDDSVAPEEEVVEVDSIEEEVVEEEEILQLPVDLEFALTERVLGNPEAPIKISEHSSFTCGHCGNFHNKVFQDFKTNWIDSGKAYLVFSDFPLNAPALYASMAVRCIKDDAKYFEAVATLFARQKDWAYATDYFTPLKAILKPFGLSDGDFKACVRNEPLQEGILERVRAAQQQFDVSSTPSFVVNNAVTVAGGSSYPEFNTVLEKAVEQAAQSGEKSPAKDTEPTEEQP